MTKKLNMLAAASLFTVATVANTQAASVPVTAATVLQNVTVALTAYSQDLAYPKTNNSKTVITGKIDSSAITTKTLIAAIGSATGKSFAAAAKLVRYTSYNDTNVYTYVVTSTNISVTATGVTNGSGGTNYTYVTNNPAGLASGTNLSFYVTEGSANDYSTNLISAYVLDTNLSTNIVLQTNMFTNSFTLSHTNFGIASTNYAYLFTSLLNTNVNAGTNISSMVTNYTTLTLTGTAVVFTNAGDGFAILDPALGTVLLTNLTFFSSDPTSLMLSNQFYAYPGNTNDHGTNYPAVPGNLVFDASLISSPFARNPAFPVTSDLSGTEKEVNGVAVYATESGTFVGTASFSLNSPTDLVLGLGGFTSGSIASKTLGKNSGGTNVYVDTFNATATVAGFCYKGGTAEVSVNTNDNFNIYSTLLPSTNAYYSYYLSGASTNSYVYVTNAAPIVVKGTVTTSFLKTIINP